MYVGLARERDKEQERGILWTMRGGVQQSLSLRINRFNTREARCPILPTYQGSLGLAQGGIVDLHKTGPTRVTNRLHNETIIDISPDIENFLCAPQDY